MDAVDFRKAVKQLSVGKRLPGAVYLLDHPMISIPRELRLVCEELRNRLSLGSEFNVLKFHQRSPKISFLQYSEFDTDPHPVLQEAVIVDLVTGSVRRSSYRMRVNPPILHRKDAFVPEAYPHFEKFKELTQAEEDAGLLEDTASIGFKLNWEKRLKASGFRIRGHSVVQATSPVLECDSGVQSPQIFRHKTAIVRGELSRPVKRLLEHKQLRRGDRFFDYGCGRGSDILGLRAMGFAADGWDPVHAPSKGKQVAEIVNLGFVLNVIEDPAERVETLLSSWKLAERLLVVATLIRGGEAYRDVVIHGDGLVTSRGTFQKHFEQGELQSLLEDTLQTEAVPVGLGVFFVFRREEDLQDFLASRSRRYINWEQLTRRLGLHRALRIRRDPYDEHKELLDAFWNTALELGRSPTEGEFDELSAVRKACGSVPRAFHLFFEKFGQATFDAARERRREDLLVFLGASLLRKRRPFTQLSARLQRDLKSFFGSYTSALDEARDLLFAAGDADELALAREKIHFGWFDEEQQHFSVHRSLLDDLPAVFRVYVECAARLYGNPREADIIKFHLRSRKLTFLHYDDFDGENFPQLKLRIKINLPRMFVTVIDHSEGGDAQILLFKERFLPADYPKRTRMERLTGKLRKLGFDEATVGHGPSKTEFRSFLLEHGLTPSLSRRKKR